MTYSVCAAQMFSKFNEQVRLDALQRVIPAAMMTAVVGRLPAHVQPHLQQQLPVAGEAR